MVNEYGAVGGMKIGVKNFFLIQHGSFTMLIMPIRNLYRLG
jgi:hypothetical protein